MTEFGRWKVNSLAVEKLGASGGRGAGGAGAALPLDPEFAQVVRRLGRRPSLQAVTDSIIRKGGVSDHLRGQEEAEPGAFVVVVIVVTETRTGPLGCSNYDNLDTVSSVLAVLPTYMRGRFVQAALNYITCKTRGQFVCRAGDCWCRCSAAFPQCNCPLADVEALETALRRIRDAWTLGNLEFQQSGEEFGRWKVNSLAVEKLGASGGRGAGGAGAALPLDPEFAQVVRRLGRRPSLQAESLTIFVDKRKLSQEPSSSSSSSSSALGSEAGGAVGGANATGPVTLETLYQLAASYFTDRESTLRRLHHLQIASTAIRVTETRTGPLGCSNYDNLDTVSSVLVHSPENKVQLQGEESLTIFVDKRKLSQEPSSSSSSSSSALGSEAGGAVGGANATGPVTETRTGPLGCSNYDNLDTAVLPTYMRGRFVQAALNYITCKTRGQFVCRAGDCWCQCSAAFPQCNCPLADVEALETALRRIRDAWTLGNLDFVGNLPAHHGVNMSAVEQLWRADAALQQRYRQLKATSDQLFSKARRAANKLFSLSKRCRKQPRIVVQRERPLQYWLNHVLSLLYCSENNQVGVYSEAGHGCSCPRHQNHHLHRPQHGACQGPVPCSLGEGPRCAACSAENRTRCSACNAGFALSQGACRPAVPDPTEPYLGLESDRDLRDLELRYLLQRGAPDIALHGVFVSNDVRMDAWFDPAWRKRMLLTLKSNRVKSNNRVHVLLGLAVQLCLSRNSTVEPAFSLFVNPFGGSHSESWTVPVGQHGYPDWGRSRLDAPDTADCYNWTLTLGNRWKSFFETVHFYLRSRAREQPGGGGGRRRWRWRGNVTSLYGDSQTTTTAAAVPGEPLGIAGGGGNGNVGYMKVNSMQLFGYSVHFDPEAIQDLILQIDYPYTQGSQDSALQQLVELRFRVNRLSPPGGPHTDLFSCLLRHRLKMSAADVARILAALRAYGTGQPGYTEYEATKLCS
ncbi:hypothetical protein CRUP_032808 [Coryphaenoides rupestris]|nr:hypothetical protein CRUP_032808 [Coryphaenoides rupestris]